MELTGLHNIPASQDVVWQMLNDPDILRQCIPGCESLLGSETEGFSAKVRIAIGPVKANFSGKVSLSNLNPPLSYTITGEGNGGVAGFASGEADVQLEKTSENGTILTYIVKARVGGKLAQLGSRLVEGTARKLASEFFNKFASLAAEKSAQPVVGETSTALLPNNKTKLWVIGATIVGAIALIQLMS